MAARLLEIEMRNSRFRMETEFYLSSSSVNAMSKNTFLKLEINRILEGVGKGHEVI